MELDTNTAVFEANCFCKACLCESSNMIQMTAATEDDITLSYMFTAITNIEISDSNAVLLYLCESCSERLNASYTFIRQCQEADEILHSYVSEQVFVAETVELKSDFDQSNSDLVDEYQDASEADAVISVKTQRVLKRPLRLVTVPISEVTRAIEETEQSFKQNVDCIKCSFTASNSRSLSRHISFMHPDVKNHWCFHCNQEVDDLTEHTKNHVNDVLKCQFCSKSFNKKGHLKEHILGHSGFRPFQCKVCKRKFLAERHLRVHKKVHLSDQPFQCHVCKARFKQNALLKKHVCKGEAGENDNFVESKRNYCTMCNKRVRNLSQHIKKIHIKPEECRDEDYKLCNKCGKKFKNSAKLHEHMKSHSGVMPYKCEHCGRKFAARNHLRMHLRTHTGEKPHICRVCGKRFAQSSILNTHMKLHTGRPEVCDICGQKFCRPSQLRIHMRKHTGEKPYACQYCDKQFVQSSHLMEHEKIHTGERPYLCEYCNKSFKQGSSLKSHINIHLGNRRFKCPVCNYACYQAYRLKMHMKIHINVAVDIKSDED